MKKWKKTGKIWWYDTICIIEYDISLFNNFYRLERYKNVCSGYFCVVKFQLDFMLFLIF